MSVLKDLGTKRVWLSVVLTVGTALLVCAVGAYAVVLGLTDPRSTGLWVCFAWLAGVVIGGRYASAGKEQVLLRGLLNGVISVGVLWLLGLTAEGAAATMPWWWTVVTVLVGAVIVALLPQRKGKGGKRKGRTAPGATRGR